MDIRTGRTYATREEAEADGVPDSDIAEVRERLNELPLVTFTSGPFRDRVYRRTKHGLVRVDGQA